MMCWFQEPNADCILLKEHEYVSQEEWKIQKTSIRWKMSCLMLMRMII